MVQDLSRKEEQRGSRQAYMWGLGIAAMVAVIMILRIKPSLEPKYAPDPTKRASEIIAEGSAIALP